MFDTLLEVMEPKTEKLRKRSKLEGWEKVEWRRERKEFRQL